MFGVKEVRFDSGNLPVPLIEGVPAKGWCTEESWPAKGAVLVKK